jgi:hypothetical protein
MAIDASSNLLAASFMVAWLQDAAVADHFAKDRHRKGDMETVIHSGKPPALPGD